mmetsp:Transcript_36735/g.112404  ORF Transcript_36735/g.112404 Transcript_36735/m.112404 type:complete len:253 (-) Transcript_36735:59-817(-)
MCIRDRALRVDQRARGRRGAGCKRDGDETQRGSDRHRDQRVRRAHDAHGSWCGATAAPAQLPRGYARTRRDAAAIICLADPPLRARCSAAMKLSVAALGLALTSHAFAPATSPRPQKMTRRNMLENGGNFGSIQYLGYRYEPPNGLGGVIDDGVTEVALKKPCGIVFEELDPNFPRGVKVLELVEGGNAEASGKIAPEDLLVAVTAVRFVGAKFERNLYDATKMGFDNVVEAIGSNEEKWQCQDVILQFRRP